MPGAAPVAAKSEAAIARVRRHAGLAVCAAVGALTLYTVVSGLLSPQLQRALFLLGAGTAVFLLQPASRRWAASDRRILVAAELAVSLFFLALLAFSLLYFLANYVEIATYREGIPNGWDLACYAAGIAAVLEAVRRTEGWSLCIVVLAVMAYLLVGASLPGLLGHKGLTLSEFLESAYGLNGMFGIALAVVADTIYIFVLYGAVMRLSGAGKVFIDLAFTLTARRRGGPAQAAVVASALFGTISGSGPANVVSTGTFTIPLMKRAGYRADFAAAVEAAASSVGQIMPPVMGVAVFIMAEITGIAYGTIMIAALVPALLFIASLMLAVWLRAARYDLAPGDGAAATRLAREDLPLLGVLAASIGTIVFVILYGRTPAMAGLAGAAVLLAGSILLPRRPSLRDLGNMLVQGGREGLGLTVSCAAIGIIIAGFSSTGLGIKLTQAIVGLGAADQFYALLMAALCCLVLGMGLPTAAAYLMVVYVAAPALNSLGIPLLASHLFIFYYAVLSAITPPVAICAFAAAGIAGASPLATGVVATRLAAVAFVLPFAWVGSPELLLLDGLTWPALWALLCAIVAMVALTAANIGYLWAPLAWPWRIAMLAAAAALLFGPLWARIAAVAAVVGMALVSPYLSGQARWAGAARFRG